jgi:hypothetical protein
MTKTLFFSLCFICRLTWLLITFILVLQFEWYSLVPSYSYSVLKVCEATFEISHYYFYLLSIDIQLVDVTSNI